MLYGCRYVGRYVCIRMDVVGRYRVMRAGMDQPCGMVVLFFSGQKLGFCSEGSSRAAEEQQASYPNVCVP